MKLPAARALGGFLNLAVFSIALASALAIMSRVLPPLEVPVVDEKLAFFADHRDEFDTLFFGSSRTYAQIFPTLFDQRTVEAGIFTTSFNFGIDGMFPPEDGYVAEQLFALHPKNLRRVFIEVSLFRNTWFAMGSGSTRALYWHDGRRLELALREAFTTYDFRSTKPDGTRLRWKDWRKSFKRWWGDMSIGKPLQRRFENLCIHAGLFLKRTLNAGRGSDLVAQLGRGTERQHDWRVLGADMRGLRQPASRREIPAPALDSFDQRLAEVTAKPARLTPMQPAQQENMRRIVALVRAAGAEPILYLAPDVTPCRRYLPDDPDIPLFDFTEVARWPQLFLRENRLDASHLDSDGAKMLTDEFARMFIEHEHGKAAR